MRGSPAVNSRTAPGSCRPDARPVRGQRSRSCGQSRAGRTHRGAVRDGTPCCRRRRSPPRRPAGGSGVERDGVRVDRDRAPGRDGARPSRRPPADAASTVEKRGSQMPLQFPSDACRKTRCANAGAAAFVRRAALRAARDSMLCRSSTVRAQTAAICCQIRRAPEMLDDRRRRTARPASAAAIGAPNPAKRSTSGGTRRASRHGIAHARAAEPRPVGRQIETMMRRASPGGKVAGGIGRSPGWRKTSRSTS